MSTPLSQFNNVQFDSFTNEAPGQHGSFNSPMSLPPMQTSAPPPNFAHHSGPPSLEGSSSGVGIISYIYIKVITMNIHVDMFM